MTPEIKVIRDNQQRFNTSMSTRTSRERMIATLVGIVALPPSELISLLLSIPNTVDLIGRTLLAAAANATPDTTFDKEWNRDAVANATEKWAAIGRAKMEHPQTGANP